MPDWDVKTWIEVLAVGWAVVSSAGMWWLSGKFASKASVETMGTRLDKAETNITALQTRVDNLPDHDDFADVREKLGQVEGSVKVAATEIRGLKDILQRIEHPLNLLVAHHLKGSQ